MEKTLVVWRRLGKEHGEDCGFQVNSAEVVEQHIHEKLERFRQTSPESWRWWQVSDRLLVEKKRAGAESGSRKTYFYLPQKNWVVVKDFIPDRMASDWKWYIHIGGIAFDTSRACWIFTDWFSDVIVKNDNATHSVLDLDELGHALRIGLITPEQLITILDSTQDLIDTIREGHFPPMEIQAFSNLDAF